MATDIEPAPQFNRIPSVSTQFVSTLPDFPFDEDFDDAPTATNIIKKKKKAKAKGKNIKNDKKKDKTGTKDKKDKKDGNTKSKKKKKKKPTKARKSSAIRDRVKQYDAITKKAKDEEKNSVVKKKNKKNKKNGKDKIDTKNNIKPTKVKAKKDKKDNKKAKKDKSISSKSSTKKDKNKKDAKKSAKNDDKNDKKDAKNGQNGDKNDKKDDKNGQNDDKKDDKVVVDDKIQTNEPEPAPSLFIQDSAGSTPVDIFNRSISPMQTDKIDVTQLYDTTSTDTTVIHQDIDTNDPPPPPPLTVITTTSSAVDDMLNGPSSTNNDNVNVDDPPAAYSRLDIPDSPVDLALDASFEKMYSDDDNDINGNGNNANLNDNKVDDNTANKANDNVMLTPEEIKKKIVEQQMFKAKRMRTQSRETVFDVKKKPNLNNLWGRKVNTFPHKNGQQIIIEWRFVASDDSHHTLVFQHEQIKKKKKTKRMLILDGIEEYNSKSKQTDFKVLVIADTVTVQIIGKDNNKYQYPFKINNVPYPVAFQQWKAKQNH